MGKQSNLSKYRTELMGIAALGVLMTHAPYTDPCPEWLQSVFSYGGISVYIFMFLSGMGLYYSLSSENRKTVVFADFYCRRLSRVILPYLLIAGSWYGIIYLLIERNILAFFYEWSTLSFWLEHGSAWYVAVLIPIYLVYPFYYRWVENGNRGGRTLVATACVLVVTSVIYMLDADLHEHLSQVLNSLLVFFLGNYYGKKIKEGRNLEEFFAFFVVFFLLVKLMPQLAIFLPSQLMLYAAEGLVVMVTAAMVLGYLHSDYLCRILRWFGDHSLELYLTNLFLIKAETFFGFGDLAVGMRAYIQYGVILCVGIILSAVLLPLEQKLAKIVLKRS